METRIVDIRKKQPRLKDLLTWIASNREIVLTEGDKPVARLVSVDSSAAPRVEGLHRGAIWASDDFDTPLPDDFWAE